MKPFGELLSHYISRAGISDAELARRLGVSRQTVFRWREGLTDRPRNRVDVLDIASKLRLAPKERDELMLAAGFSPEQSIPEEPSAASDGFPDKTAPQLPRSLSARQRWAIIVAGTILILVASIAIWREAANRLSFEAPTVAPSAPGETLVLISTFVNYGREQAGFNVAGRLRETLGDELEAAGLDMVRVEVVPEPILHEVGALELGGELGAQLVVWGEYDSGRVIVLMTPLGNNDLTSTAEKRWHLSATGELLSVINSDLPEEVRWLAIYILGQTHLRAGRLDEAKIAFDRALSSPPADTDSLGGLYFHLGLLESKREAPDLNEVVAYYTEALELQPGHVSAMNNRALAYFGRNSPGDLERAQADLQEAHELAPDDVVYITNLALVLTRMGSDNLEEAIELLEDAERQAPESPSIQNSLCWLYGVGGRADEALPHCDSAVELDPTGYSNDSRGLSLALLGEFDEAVAEFEFFLNRLEAEDKAGYDRYSPSRLEWIAALQAGENPFDEATLQALIGE